MTEGNALPYWATSTVTAFCYNVAKFKIEILLKPLPTNKMFWGIIILSTFTGKWRILECRSHSGFHVEQHCNMAGLTEKGFLDFVAIFRDGKGVNTKACSYRDCVLLQERRNGTGEQYQLSNSHFRVRFSWKSCTSGEIWQESGAGGGGGWGKIQRKS